MNDEQTPIEEYYIDGHDIWVKRDDLFLASKQPMVPALAKLRGARVVLQKMKIDGITRVACFDTRISKSGQGIAFLCQELGLQCLVGYPRLKKQFTLNEPQRMAKSLGAEVMAIQAGRTAPCYAAFRREASLRGYEVLPLGITFTETAKEVSKIAEQDTIGFATVVVSTGTGTIATGIALGTDADVIGVSCGMNTARQMKRVRELCFGTDIFYPQNLTLIQTSYDYYDTEDTESCPFPTSPYYDMKAWIWMLKHFEELKQPVLFWNVGV